MRTLTFTRVLGSGAFGTVYLADLVGERGFRRQVAVKVLLSHVPDAELFVSRVRDEARLLGLLHDDAILEVIELVRIEDRDAVVMEYVEGVDLGLLIERGACPPPRAAAELAAAVAGALQSAHAARHPETGEPLNVVHRDVKPANIMVTERGAIKLLDFGVARARFAARESHTGQFVLGTLNYMAPEYVLTGEVDAAADIYGLGISLWEALTGEVYGQPKLKSEAHHKRLDERLGRLDPSWQPLTTVLRDCLRWRPEERPGALAVEQRLHDAADALGGPGIRSWAGDAVRKALAERPPHLRDEVGLLGRTVRLTAGADAPPRPDDPPTVWAHDLPSPGRPPAPPTQLVATATPVAPIRAASPPMAPPPAVEAPPRPAPAPPTSPPSSPAPEPAVRAPASSPPDPGRPAAPPTARSVVPKAAPESPVRRDRSRELRVMILQGIVLGFVLSVLVLMLVGALLYGHRIFR